MVFFTCNVCNESLKKNQVEKHYLTKCRRCEYLSCVDCGHDFWGDTYQTHIKCISEDEKYSGKNYVPKVNKGEVKQEQWIQKVQSAIQKASSNPQLKNLLQRLEDFPNVPRKKAKFENFLKCSLRVFNVGLLNQVWDLLMAEAKPQNGTSTQGEGEGRTEKSDDQNGTAEDAAVSRVETPEEKDDAQGKLSKRERKEERRKKAHKAEKKDRQAEENGASRQEEGERKRKGKRRKRDEEEDEQVEEDAEPRRKKRKEAGGAAETSEAATDAGVPSDSEEAEEKKTKFSWEKTIRAVLKSKGEISVKRLSKKVLSEYALQGNNKPEDKLMLKLNKKLRKMHDVKLEKEKARLVSS